MKNLLSTTITTIVLILIAVFIVGSDFKSQIQSLKTNVENVSETLGADAQKFIGGTTYTLAGSGITSSATSLTLTSLTIPQNDYPIQDSDLGDIFYLTLEPGNTSRQEFVSCTTVGSNTGGNVAISGCTRGLSPISPYTASSTLQFSHAGGTKAIFSNPPQLYDKAAFKDNDESVTGLWTFNSLLPTSSITATSSNQFTIKSYVDALVNQGAATSTESLGGIVELATVTEVASSTQTTANQPFVIQAQNATSTPTYSCDASGTTGALCLPVAENDGKLSQLWLDLTSAFSWSGLHTFSSGVLLTASSTAASTFHVNTPTADAEAANKSYVDNSSFVNRLYQHTNSNALMEPIGTTVVATTTPYITGLESNDTLQISLVTLCSGNCSAGTLTQRVLIGDGTATSTFSVAQSSSYENTLIWNINVRNRNNTSAQIIDYTVSADNNYKKGAFTTTTMNSVNGIAIVVDGSSSTQGSNYINVEALDVRIIRSN